MDKIKQKILKEIEEWKLKCYPNPPDKHFNLLPTEGEIYTMKEIFRENIKFYKGISMNAEEILENSKWD